MKKFLVSLLGSAVLLLTSLPLLATPPVINSVTPASGSIPRYGKFEATLNLTATYTNPYNYSEISTQGRFTAPSGRIVTVDGFYIQDQQIGTGSWV